jgi:CBS domain-containing protein
MVLYAKDIAEPDFLTLPASDSILEAAKRMRDSRHGFVIIGERGAPQGIVTEWDILSKIVAEGTDPKTVTLKDIMISDLVSVDENTGLSVVSQLMTEKGVRRLLVRRGGEIVGVITAKTMLAHMSEYVDKVSSQISRLQTPMF